MHKASISDDIIVSMEVSVKQKGDVGVKIHTVEASYQNK